MKLYKLNKQDDVAYISDAISGDDAEVGGTINRVLNPGDYGTDIRAIDEDVLFAGNPFIVSWFEICRSTGTSGWVTRFSMLHFKVQGVRAFDLLLAFTQS